MLIGLTRFVTGDEVRRFMMIRAAVVATALMLAIVTAEARANTIDAPSTAKPGRKVTLRVSGFPAGARIRVQFGLYMNPPANCCASKVMPAREKPGYLIPDAGSRTLRVRMPRRYAKCTSARCEDPEWTRYRRGDRIYVITSSDDPGQPLYAKDLLKVR